jgi:MFS family permease
MRPGTSTTTLDPPAEAPGSYRATLLILLAGQLMALVDVTIVNVAMPTIGSRLSASGSEIQLLVVGYTISYAVLLITGARLGAVYGRRRLYMSGVFIFTAASLMCGLAPSVGLLLTARFIEGAGAAAMVPQIISIIQVRFTARARAIALSAYSGVLASGFVIGQVAGGIIVTSNLFNASWRPIFLVNIPIGVAIFALAPHLLPKDESPSTGRGKFDIPGLAVSAAAVFAIVMPLVIGHQLGWPVWSRTLIVLGFILAVTFVLLERRVRVAPLLHPLVVRAPGFRVGLGAVAFVMTAYGSLLFTMSIYLQSFLHYDALRAAATFAPSAAVFGLCGLLWNKLPERWHNAVIPVGLGICAIGITGLAFTVGSNTSAYVIGAILITYGFGGGFGFSLLLTRTLAKVPRSNAAEASGLLTTTMQLSQSIGVATLGGVFLDRAPGDPGTAIAAVTGWEAFLLAIAVVMATLVARSSRTLQD